MERNTDVTDGFVQTRDWPDPSEEMLGDPRFEAVWQCIKTWDINVPGAYKGYSQATGNHVRAILDALQTGYQQKIPWDSPHGFVGGADYDY